MTAIIFGLAFFIYFFIFADIVHSNKKCNNSYSLMVKLPCWRDVGSIPIESSKWYVSTYINQDKRVISAVLKFLRLKYD